MRHECNECGRLVSDKDPYYSTPCGTFCTICMEDFHINDCEICRKEFDLDDEDDDD
jgi:hypothetical protein